MLPTFMLVFLAMSPVVVIFAQQFDCGKQGEKYKADINELTHTADDNNAKEHSWPWLVYLNVAIRRNKRALCGASLVRVLDDLEKSDIVVTSARCLATNEFKADLFNQREPFKAKQISAHFGANNDKKGVPGQKSLGVSEVHLHPEYTHKGADDINIDIHNNIAVVKLAKPVRFSGTIRPICLPAQGAALPPGRQCAVAGWGSNNGLYADQNDQHFLKDSAVTVQKESACVGNKSNPMNYLTAWGDKYVEAEMICTGAAEEGSKDHCIGDPGGVLACQDDSKYTLYGTASFGYGLATCSTTPPIYSRISAHVDWIKAMAKKLTSVKQEEAFSILDWIRKFFHFQWLKAKDDAS